MIHLRFAFYLLALVAGTAALAQTVLIGWRYRKTVIRWYGLFLLSLYAILLSFLIRQYGEVAGLAGSRALENGLWILQAAGGLTFIFTAPFFYHALLGLPFRRGLRFAFLAVDALVVLAAGIDLALPGRPEAVAVLVGSLFGMIAYGLVLIAVKLPGLGDRVLRRALALFLGLTLFFFPWMLVDVLLGLTPLLASFRFLDGLTQPLYFLLLNGLTVVFGLRYLNRPAYAEGDRLTDYFVAAFGVTEREREIIGRLLEGEGVKEVADALFISAKTVENHVYNIYQKLGVRSRVQLYQLIRANAVE